ncbi:GAF domain-containing sensor histidine kinase [Planococcus sp. FY231025]|uniref:GAF domain-containing sensor histidine kinase n=1 Tax=Planococcus sp. FY231025 TaxID=3455699 RepID=UPI003F92316E
MKQTSSRHYTAQLFMTLISAIGWSVAVYAAFGVQPVRDPYELLFLIAFIFIAEYFPMPFQKGNSSLTFPIVYLAYLLYGIEITSVLYFSAVLFTTLINQRPLRIIFFNPAQLVLSLFLADKITTWAVPQLGLTDSALSIFFLLLFIGSFYLINNGIVDIVLLLRPEKYTFSTWLQKSRAELFSFSISMVYGMLLHYLGNQNRGDGDILSYFFFLSPLIFLAIISSVIIRLSADKLRLKALFHFSSELNKAIPISGWENEIKGLIKEVVSYEESYLLTRDEKGNWNLAIADGDLALSKEAAVAAALDQVKSTTVYNKSDIHLSPLAQHFNPAIQSAVFAPLIFENELVGCLIMAKTRTNSFIVEDVHSISTIANQLAIFLKTQMLFSEKEQRILLEERNRIAHDIHDGIAQILAGAVMKFDAAAKKIHSHPQDAQWLVNDSNNILRGALQEIRDSIYALRPYPTEQHGLYMAIKNKIEELNRDKALDLDITFESRGIQPKLNLVAEKAIFSIIQESLHNCIKHACARKVGILLNYQRDQILLTVKDDGIGFSLYEAMTAAMKEPHYGILQMNEDAEKVGAAFQIESSKNNGTEIFVRIPKAGFKGGQSK